MRKDKLQELGVKQDVKYFCEDELLNPGLYSQKEWNNTVPMPKSI